MSCSENNTGDQPQQHQQHEQLEQQDEQQQNVIVPSITPSFQNLFLEMQQYEQTVAAATATSRCNSDPFGRANLVFPDPSQHHLLPWSFPQGVVTPYHHDPFGLFTKRPSYDGPGGPSDHHLRLLSDALGPMAAQPSSAAPFGLQHELNKMTAQEIMDAKALAASKSHSEAERRRRERINNHLAKLRSLLPNTTKTDKASLLAEVIQHMKELRRQTSVIAETSTVPTESDELTVDPASDGQDGKFIIKASLCCDDRPDLIPDLIKALKSLRLKTLKAEITTLGGRFKNVLFVTQEPPSGEDDPDHQDDQPCSITSIHEALKAVMEKSNGGDESTSGNAKRQRTSSINIS